MGKLISLPCCVAWEIWVRLSEARFPRVQNEANRGRHITGWLSGFNAIVQTEGLTELAAPTLRSVYKKALRLLLITVNYIIFPFPSRPHFSSESKPSK